MRDILLGLSFLEINGALVDVPNKLLQLPDITLQLNYLQSDTGEKKAFKTLIYDLFFANCNFNKIHFD